MTPDTLAWLVAKSDLVMLTLDGQGRLTGDMPGQCDWRMAGGPITKPRR